MYGPELADVYEAVYRNRGKDWKKEAQFIAELIRDRLPAADALLDVACGTGAHLAGFAELFDRVEGLELADSMRAVAERRLPGVPLHAGDMREFRLPTKFDAVTCMFTAISYVETLAGMRSAVRCMAEHLVPGGVLVIEPWWFPEKFIDGYVSGELVRDGDRTIARVSRSTNESGVTRLDVRYVVASAAGITQFTEIDRLALFTLEEYLGAMEDAGCTAEFQPPDPAGRDAIVPAGRGLFVGVKRS